MSTTTQLTTAEELLAMPDDGFRYELVEGELRRMSPAGHNHGRIVMRLAIPLGKFIADHNLGAAYAAETGFKLKSNPDTVRAPDVSFIRRERVEEIGETEGFWPGAPDLAVEVNSPGDRVGEVEEKVQEWLDAGTRLVWVVSPKLRVVTVYRSLTDIVTLTEKDLLDGGEVVPGFQFPVAELFAL
ncbi:MAG TPA: Uma2 family endonuclease [Pyrinomonadaceae bacterium]|jgi:Uma2 family endonuclease|nr:Uma2 family endonuclease [Pyrinomonadaceae bacterium]